MATDAETQAWTFGGLGTWAAGNVVNFTAGLANHTPGVGHLIAGYMYYAAGDTEGAARVCRQATRSAAVISAGVFSPVAAGLTGAAVFAVGVGAGYDYAVTSLDRANYGEGFPASGHVETIEQVTGYLQGRNELTAGELARYSGRIALDMALGMTAAQLSSSLLTPQPTDVVSSGMGGSEAAGTPAFWNRLGLDQAGLNNRANQLNPNHVISGPGRSSGYHGLGTPVDLNNHANQLNPNNALYCLSRSSLG